MLRPGERIGPLCVERRIGAGGMGEVYVARDERLERQVAIKLLPEARGMDQSAHLRLLREARSLSALKHPGIVTIHDIGTHGGLSYIVMEYVEGETFDDLIARRGALPETEAVDVIAQVGDAVGTAHDAGVLHRDLKSANLMIGKDGRVKVLDFGLAKRTDGSATTSRPPSRPSAPIVRGPRSDLGGAQTVASVPNELVTGDTTPAPAAFGDIATMPAASNDPSSGPTTPAPSDNGSGTSTEPHTVVGAGMGTPGWAPPELYEGREADARSDVFSLACVFYHLITGKPPFHGATWVSQHALVPEGATPPSELIGTGKFDALIAAALDPDPDKRPADVRAFVAGLRGALAPPRPRKRTSLKVIALLGIAGLAASSIAVVMIARSRASGGTPEARVPTATKPEQLTSTGACAYSPAFVDADTITFDLTKDGAVDLYRLDLAPGAKPVQLTSDAEWEWRSAPGAVANETVFLVQGKGVTAIDALDLVGGKRRRLVDQTGAAVGVGGDYFYAPEAGKLIRRIHDGADEPFVSLELPIDTMIVSPDGKRLGLLMFDAKHLPQLCTVEIANRTVACFEVPAASARPAFSATGDALYFQLLRKGHLIGRVPIRGGATIEIPTGRTSVGGIAVSPAGGTLVFSSCTARSELVSVLDDPARPLLDDEQTTSPAYGAGGALAYVSRDGLATSIVIRAPDGRRREHYRRKDGVISQLAFDTDARQLAFVLTGGSAPGIYTLSLASSSAPNRITEDPRDTKPIFAGDHILFTRDGADGTPQLMRVALDGSGVKAASTRPRLTVASATGRVLVSSPDERYFYWLDPETGGETPAIPPPGTSPPVDVALSPDGQWVMFVAGGNGEELWRARATDPASLALVHELPGDRSVREGAIDDRGHPVVVANTWAGELWMMRAGDGARW